MKLLWENYTFTPASQSIKLNSVPASTPLFLENILLVTNVSSNVIMYNFADNTYSGSYNNSTNVLSISYPTVGMTSNDRLQIFIDDGNTPATDSTLQTLQQIATAQSDNTFYLKRMVKLLESNAVVDSCNRQIVNIETATGTTGPGLKGTVQVVAYGATNAAASTYTCNGPTTNVANPSPWSLATVGPIPIAEVPVDQRWRIIHEAKNAFANGIRQRLVTS